MRGNSRVKDFWARRAKMAALIAQMVERLVVDVEVLFRYDAERADGGERAAAVQLVRAITINDQFPLWRGALPRGTD